jgi:TonB-dependent starch-binding outer membrane protein SusC
MKKRINVMLSMFILGILLSGAAGAQGIKVAGKIKDAADGSPLAGVTILEKGTTNGTMTDVNGTYSITVPSAATLVVSYVGYLTQEIPVNNRTTIDVSLALDVQALQEVVVIGYGTVTKKDATGSVVAVGTRDFSMGNVSRPQDLIMGKVPGVSIVTDGGSPSAGATIRIRGGSSLSASNSPLIVIDGVPVDNSGISGMGNPLSLVNSNDIESFTVLKDASATAIYGSRASNGVILITTKKGSAGRPFHVSYDGSFALGTRTGSIDVLSSEEYRSVIYSKYAVGSPAVNALGKENTDWQKQIYQTATTMDHNLSFSGSVKTIPYRASVGYTDQTGILKTSELGRLTSSLNLNPSFLDNHLMVNVAAKYMNIKNRFANQGAIGGALSMDPTHPVYDAVTGAKYGGYYTWLQTNGDPISINAPFNPIAQLEQTNDRSYVDRFLGNVQVDYKLHFLPDLKITVNAGADYSWSDGKTIVDQNAAWYWNNGRGRYNIYNQQKKNKLLDIYGNYKKDLPSIHSRIDFTAGYSWQHFYNQGSYWERNYSKTITYQDTKYYTESYLVSFFGRLNYVFMEKYLLTATLRDDGSSKFSQENRWGLFPSLAFAWDIKQEGFMGNMSSVSALKLRVGYGKTGQQDIPGGDYPYLARYTFSQDNAQYQFGNGFITTLRPEGYDSNLRWETTTTYNAAIDFGFLKDRITGTVEAYYRPTEDLINTIDVPAGTNLTNRITTNVGNLTNKGVELAFNFKPFVTPTYEWSIGLNGTMNINEITKLTALDDPNFIGVETGGISGGVGNNVQINTVGYPRNTFYLAEQVYDSQGMPVDNLYVDRNGDGTVTSQGQSDKYRVGKPDPDWLIGFNSMFRYKNFDFSFNGRVSLGNYVYNNVQSGTSYSDMYTSVGSLYNRNSVLLRTKFANPQYWSDYFLENGSFLRLDNMVAGYSFDNLAQGAAKLRVFVSAQNLFVITKYSGLDPEIFGGIDGNVYPRPRTIMFGVNLDF